MPTGLARAIEHIMKIISPIIDNWNDPEGLKIAGGVNIPSVTYLLARQFLGCQVPYPAYLRLGQQSRRSINSTQMSL